MVLIQIFDLQNVSHGHELQHRQLDGFFGGLQDGEKLQIYFKLFSTLFTNKAYGHTHRTGCFSPKNVKIITITKFNPITNK